MLTIGVGFIAGRGGVAFIIGGFVAYWFLSPMLSVFGDFPLDEVGVAISDPGSLRLLLYRPLGIGMLIGGALMGVALAFPLIISTVRSMQKASSIGANGGGDEMPIKMLYFAIVGTAIVLAVIAVNSVESVSILRGIGMAVMGTLWIWMSGIILSEAIGRTNWSPLSGMTLIGITLLIIVTAGMERGDSIVAAIMVGAGNLRRDVASHRLDVGFEDWLFGWCHAENATARPIHRSLVRSYCHYCADLRFGKRFWFRRGQASRATRAGAREHGRGHSWR